MLELVLRCTGLVLWVFSGHGRLVRGLHYVLLFVYLFVYFVDLFIYFKYLFIYLFIYFVFRTRLTGSDLKSSPCLALCAYICTMHALIFST